MLTVHGRMADAPVQNEKMPLRLRHTWGLMQAANDRCVWRMTESPSSFKDCKAWVTDSGVATVKEWVVESVQSGKGRRPGVRVADVEEIVDAGVGIVVISQGVSGKLQCPAETLEFLERSKVQVVRLTTPNAVTKFNELVAEGRAVGGLFHSTC